MTCWRGLDLVIMHVLCGLRQIMLTLIISTLIAAAAGIGCCGLDKKDCDHKLIQWA